MSAIRIILFGTMALMLMLRPVSAGVAVHFADLQQYNSSDFGSATPQATLSELAGHLQKLGARLLKPNQTLRIDILRVDLAGMIEPFGTQQIRVMRDSTPPRIRLRYTLSQGRRVLQRDEETISDINYLMNSSRASSGGRLYYEKEMLTDWFRRRFAAS
ncbi:DUF3016 domain-containing protein [Bradyrhizobium prioriisuperbiae]|uniref:DUF3016 domain-containing protein n=1 Tax=Bradyrhizobium prioriisuperbiae TaxID=2854389 RepID=UPI0028E1AFB2|nr:DUF3016 domain-containing protein [Bradyrhizobium prioritasuperba]